jgi:hypothetical protein
MVIVHPALVFSAVTVAIKYVGMPFPYQAG